MMEMSETGGNIQGLVLAKSNLAQLIYAFDGRIGEALKCSQEALQLALRADDLFLKGWAHYACGLAFFRKGLFPQAEENLTLAIEMTQKNDITGILLLCFWHLGQLRHKMGRYQEGHECCDAFLAVVERVRMWPSMARIVQIMKVAIKARGGLDPALDTVQNFDLKEIRMKWVQGWAALLTGEIYLYLDDKHMDEAEVWIRKAIEINEQNRVPWDLARDYALYAEFFKKKADPLQAKEKLGKAIDLMRSIGADGWVKKYEAELAIIEK